MPERPPHKRTEGTLHAKKNVEIKEKTYIQEPFNATEERRRAGKIISDMKQFVYASGVNPSIVSKQWARARDLNDEMMRTLEDYKDANYGQKQELEKKFKSQIAALQGNVEERLRLAVQRSVNPNSPNPKGKSVTHTWKDGMAPNEGYEREDIVEKTPQGLNINSEGEVVDKLMEGVENDEESSPKDKEFERTLRSYGKAEKREYRIKHTLETRKKELESEIAQLRETQSWAKNRLGHEIDNQREIAELEAELQGVRDKLIQGGYESDSRQEKYAPLADAVAELQSITSPAAEPEGLGLDPSTGRAFNIAHILGVLNSAKTIRGKHRQFSREELTQRWDEENKKRKSEGKPSMTDQEVFALIETTLSEEPKGDVVEPPAPLEPSPAAGVTGYAGDIEGDDFPHSPFLGNTDTPTHRPPDDLPSPPPPSDPSPMPAQRDEESFRIPVPTEAGYIQLPEDLTPKPYQQPATPRAPTPNQLPIQPLNTPPAPAVPPQQPQLPNQPPPLNHPPAPPQPPIDLVDAPFGAGQGFGRNRVLAGIMQPNIKDKNLPPKAFGGAAAPIGAPVPKSGWTREKNRSKRRSIIGALGAAALTAFGAYELIHHTPHPSKPQESAAPKNPNKAPQAPHLRGMQPAPVPQSEAPKQPEAPKVAPYSVQAEITKEDGTGYEILFQKLRHELGKDAHDSRLKAYLMSSTLTPEKFAKSLDLLLRHKHYSESGITHKGDKLEINEKEELWLHKAGVEQPILLMYMRNPNDNLPSVAHIFEEVPKHQYKIDPQKVTHRPLQRFNDRAATERAAKDYVSPAKLAPGTNPDSADAADQLMRQAKQGTAQAESNVTTTPTGARVTMTGETAATRKATVTIPGRPASAPPTVSAERAKDSVVTERKEKEPEAIESVTSTPEWNSVRTHKVDAILGEPSGLSEQDASVRTKLLGVLKNSGVGPRDTQETLEEYVARASAIIKSGNVNKPIVALTAGKKNRKLVAYGGDISARTIWAQEAMRNLQETNPAADILVLTPERAGTPAIYVDTDSIGQAHKPFKPFTGKAKKLPKVDASLQPIF
jgi:hypothetical protein